MKILTKYIFKDDGINGVKVQYYDYEVVETEGRLIITEAVEAVEGVDYVAPVEEILAVEAVLDADGNIISEAIEAVEAVEEVLEVLAVEAVEYSEFQEPSTFEDKQTSKSKTIRVMPDTDFLVLNNTDNSEESVFVPMAQEIKDFAKKCFTTKVKKEYKARKDAEKVEDDKARAIEDAKPKLFTGDLKIGTQTFFIENGLIKVK